MNLTIYIILLKIIVFQLDLSLQNSNAEILVKTNPNEDKIIPSNWQTAK